MMDAEVEQALSRIAGLLNDADDDVTLRERGNLIDVWEDEGDGGFVIITDNDTRLAITVGVRRTK